MNKIATLFAAITLSATSLVSAQGVELPEWNHANDSNYPLVNVQEVQYSGVKMAAKDDDRIKFTAPGHAAEDNGAYQYLGRSENR